MIEKPIKINLREISHKDYMPRELLEEIINDPQRRRKYDPDMVDFAERVRILIPTVDNGRDIDTTIVLQEDEGYRILSGGEVVSAYAYVGKTEIPVRERVLSE